MSTKHLAASAAHFYSKTDDELNYKFADKFCDQIESVFANTHRDYSNAFFVHLCPSFLSRESDLDKLQAILERAMKTSDTNFQNLLRCEIELLKQSLKLKMNQ